MGSDNQRRYGRRFVYCRWLIKRCKRRSTKNDSLRRSLLISALTLGLIRSPGIQVSSSSRMRVLTPRVLSDGQSKRNSRRGLVVYRRGIQMRDAGVTRISRGLIDESGLAAVHRPEYTSFLDCKCRESFVIQFLTFRWERFVQI